MAEWLRGYPDGWNVLQPCHVFKDDIAGDDAMLTAEQARIRFNYDSATGILTWTTTWRRMIKGNEAGSKKLGYRRVNVDSKSYQVHRVIWLMVYGQWPVQIDHINGIKDDNRLVNLREVDTVENCRNKPLPITNKSGVMGVYWDSKAQKWDARIMIKQKNIYLGRFDDLQEARIVRRSAEVKYGFSPNHGRRQHA